MLLSQLVSCLTLHNMIGVHVLRCMHTTTMSANAWDQTGTCSPVHSCLCIHLSGPYIHEFPPHLGMCAETRFAALVSECHACQTTVSLCSNCMQTRCTLTNMHHVLADLRPAPYLRTLLADGTRPRSVIYIHPRSLPSGASCQQLSLIHISEPTRPY